MIVKINLLDIDRLISVNKLKEVTHGRIYSGNKIFHQDGIFSYEIFGIQKADRRGTFAYIDLKRRYIHPHIYANVLKRMFGEIIYIIPGLRKYSIIDGKVVEDEENGWTGLDNLYKHWDEINWKIRGSRNKQAINMLSKLNKDQIFINKFLVCPPAYRDIVMSGTMDTSDHVAVVNNLYTKLIRSCASIEEGGIFNSILLKSQMKIQELLSEIFEYFKDMISSKTGLMRKYLLGKSVDFGTRSVISAPTYNTETLDEMMVDIDHCALPLSHACSTFYPFIESWVKNFFRREVINDPNLITFYDDSKNKVFIGNLKDPEVQFSDVNIKKMINNYIFNPDVRYRIIKVDATIPMNGNKEKNVKAVLKLKGKIILENNVLTELDRPMTLTDILYLAAVDVCEKRHVMVSRYPVGTDKGIFFNKINVQTTKTHIRVMFNGREYPFYPDIDLNTPHDKVGVQFIDSIVYSNSLLEGMGADYDGDTVPIRGLWSDEANLEAEKIMNSKMSALNINGTNSRVVSKEVYNSCYELTKIGKNGKIVNTYDQKSYLEMRPNEFTRSKITSMFSNTADISQGNKTNRRNSKHNTWDKMVIPANYFYQGHDKIETTVGRFLFNKYVLDGAGIIQAAGFIDDVLNKKGLGKLDNLIAQLYMEDVIDRTQFNAYINRRDALGYWLNGMLAHTISERMLKPLKEIEIKKKELYKKYEKEILAGDIDVMTNVSDELVAYAKELLKDDPGMDLYLSGDLDFDNNYKNNAILKGPVMNELTNEFDFVGTSFMDGIDIKDIPAHANSILSAQYPASIATRDAGYMGKKILALLQMIEIDEPDTDCGTKNPIHIIINDTNKDDLLYSYIVVNGQLQLLTKENISSYIGKTVAMRSPMTCISKKICSKCAGELFYKLGVKHAGLFSTQLSHSALNLGLKAKHVQTISLYHLNPDNIIENI